MSNDIWKPTLAPKAWAVHGDILCEIKLTIQARLLYAILCGYSRTWDGEMSHFPSTSDLSAHLGCPLEVAQGAKEELFDCGLVEYVRDQDSHYIRYSLKKEGE